MSNSANPRPLLLVSLLAALVTVVDGGSSDGDDSTAVAAKVATLGVHRIRAVDNRPVIDLVLANVPAQRVAWLAESRSLAVFAIPAVQQTIAEVITAHENAAFLFERIGVPESLRDELEPAVREALVANAAVDTRGLATQSPARFEIDVATNQMSVWGFESQISKVREVVHEAEQREAARRDRSDAATGLGSADTSGSAIEVVPPSPAELAVESHVDQRHGESRPLLVPRGPVRIVYAAGLDLWLIRAQGGRDGQRLPVPSGKVTIDSTSETQ